MTPPKIVAGIEARMAASRLPGKVLADVNGIPLLGVLIARLKQASSINDIVIATTTESADDSIVKFAKREGIQVFRGSEDDVLKRVVEANLDAEAQTRLIENYINQVGSES